MKTTLNPALLIQAAERGLSVDSIEVEVTGEQHPLAQQPGFENFRSFHTIFATRPTSFRPMSAEAIRALHETVEAVFPIFNLLKQLQTIDGEPRHTVSAPVTNEKVA